MSSKLNKAVAITGGARGIGAATAQAFAARGARVAIGDIDAELAVKTANDIANETGATVVGFGVDVTDSTQFASFLTFAVDELGGLDVLVNNAGIMPTGEFLAESEAVSDRQFDINVRAVVTGSKLAGTRFKAQKSGHIVNVASMAGLAGIPGLAVYCASKFAVVGLGEALQQELAPDGIKVTTIAPSFVKTELIAGLTPTWLVRQLGLIEPSDVANAIVGAVADGHSGKVVLPSRSGLILKATSPLPDGVRVAIAKVMGLGDVMLHADEAGRAAYKARTETVPDKPAPSGRKPARSGR